MGRKSICTPLSSRTAMPRDWTDVFITGDGAAVAAAAEEPEQRRGFFRRLRENLSKTREALGAEIQATLFEGDLDSETWERLEEALIMADVGARDDGRGRRASSRRRPRPAGSRAARRCRAGCRAAGRHRPARRRPHRPHATSRR